MNSSDGYPLLQQLAFATSGLDRMSHVRTDETWLASRWQDPQTQTLAVERGHVATLENPAGAGQWLDWREPGGWPGHDHYFLGVDGAGHARFAVPTAGLASSGPTAGLRELASVLHPVDAGAVVHAIALDNWHVTHQFCPRCGARTEVAAAGAERRCPADGSAHFPRIDPAVIVLVTDPAGRALLGRQAEWPPGRFSTLAGFVEPGESAEHAVVREVAEESTVLVSAVHYVGSQPWPFPSSLMLGYFAEAGDCQPVPDGAELEQVRWFSRAELADAITSGTVVAPSGISISRRLVERWFGQPLPQGVPGSEWR